MKHALIAGLMSIAVLGMAACKREQAMPPATPATKPMPVATQAAAPPLALKDVVENDPRYIIGVSYPAGAAAYPQGLAVELQKYADAGRAELLQAVEGLAGQKPSAPYDMSLSFTELANTPQLLAVAADGSVYTGGAHGNPLMARFIWLPQQQQMLTAERLLADPQGWRAVSDAVREELHAALSQRVDADGLEPATRAEVVKGAGKMIDEGTKPVAASFAQFEPVIAQGGKLAALRFVFPPYQVGPYSDGVQTVELPASILLPLVAPEYRSLFATSG